MGEKKEVIAILFLVVISSGVISAYAVADQIGSDFIVEGCNVNGDGVGRASCSGDGNFFCDSTSTLYNTILDEGACTMGNSTFSTGDAQCCPAGYGCSGSGDPSTYTCNQLSIVCGNNTDESSCTAISGCFWVAEESYCTDSPSDFSCSVYTKSSTCESDVLNFGKEGFGTEVCGEIFLHDKPLKNTVYVIPKSTCRCEWDSSTSECKLHYSILPDIYAIDGTKDSFSCEKNFTIGLCIDGQQEINWTAKGYDFTGNFTGGIWEGGLGNIEHTDITLDTKCINSSIYETTPGYGKTTRSCGEETITLPGISGLSILIAILSITLFYFWRENKK